MVFNEKTPTQQPETKLTLYYIRVSTIEQAGGAESQTRSLMEWGQKNNIKNYEVYADHGISGAKESRPALNRLMERIKEGNSAQVVCFAFSRMARSTTHLLKILEFCKLHKTRFLSVTEAIDTDSPMGICLFTILGCLAQLERELIRERVVAGLKNARAKGKIIGRVRKRNDILIHSLLDAQMSFRTIAKIANCSHGSISASKKEWAAKKAQQEALEILPIPLLPPASPSEKDVSNTDPSNSASIDSI
jgi:DNA invertase Pin-like site-specific DNA recombinase